MNALLLVAHGSRRNQSNDEVINLASMLEVNCSDQYDMVAAAFLEIAEPSISEGIRKCVLSGATSIVVLPYFLNSGRHVTTDIPAEVEVAKQACPGVDIKIVPHIGSSKGMTGLLVHSAVCAVND